MKYYQHHLSIIALGLLGWLSTSEAEITGLGRGLHAYWPLDTHTQDVTSRYHLESRDLNNPVPLTRNPSNEPVLPGNVAALDGKSQWLATESGTDIDLLAFDEGFTVAAWFKVNKHGFWDCVIAGGGANHWELRLQRGNGLLFTITAPTGATNVAVSTIQQSVGTQKALEEGRWYHIAVRGSAGAVTNLFPPLEKTLAMYLDGDRIASRDFSTVEPDSPALQDGHFRPESFAPPKQLKLGVTPYGNRGLLDGDLDDVAIWQRALDDAEIARLADASAGPLMASLDDKDQDGLLDVWECQNGLDTTIDDSAMDPDQDGLSNAEEAALGTAANLADSDGDGLTDGAETLTGRYVSAKSTGTNPRLADSDRDGLADGVEIGFSDPNVADTDGDGYPDGLETADGTDSSKLEPLSPLGRGLYAYWSFDGHVHDQVGGFHGRAEGSQPLDFVDMIDDDVQVPYGRALWLDGQDQYVVMSDDPSAFDFPEQSFSVSAWMAVQVRGDTFPTAVGSGGQQPWLLGGFSDQGTFAVFNPGTDQVQPFPQQNDFISGSLVSGPQVWSQISTGRLLNLSFTHVVGVYDHEARHYHVYVNGERTVLRNTNAVGVAARTMHGLRIGSAPNDWERPEGNFKGAIDEVAVWKRALSDADISMLYQSDLSLGQLLDLSAAQVTPAPTRFRDPRVRRDAESVTIDWAATLGKSYAVQHAETLDGPWNMAKLIFSADRTLMSFSDTDPERIAPKQGYYRVVER